MNVEVLVIRVGDVRAGVLFRYQPANTEPVVRFMADESFAQLPPDRAPVLSAAFLAGDVDTQRAVWANFQAAAFNGRRGARGDFQLPAWFQGLLPEGAFRAHIAARAGCDPLDHFSLLAACGRDLPGNVTALWEDLPREALQRLVTQNQDALEMSVTADRVQDAVSLSGVQPKLAVMRTAGGRYVGRTHLDGGTHVIAKLPTVEYPRMPQVEHLSLALARAAGVTTCEHALVPLAQLGAAHDYDLGGEAEDGSFLAVERFDRSTPFGADAENPQTGREELPDTGTRREPMASTRTRREPMASTRTRRVHVETFAQVFGVAPEHKYTGASYLDIGAALMALPGCGEPAVHELLRRLVVNELIGNADAHLANFGLIYRDGRTAELSPAYDVVAFGVYQVRDGHALHLLPPATAAAAGLPQRTSTLLAPATLKLFCEQLRLPVLPASAALRRCVEAAVRSWPALVHGASITDRQKTRLLQRVGAHPLVQSLLRRRPALRAGWPQADTVAIK